MNALTKCCCETRRLAAGVEKRLLLSMALHLLLLPAFLLSFCTIAHAAPPPQDGWHCAGGNAQRTRRSPYDGPQTDHVKWTCQLGGELSEPVVARNGTVYVGSFSADPEDESGMSGKSTLYAVRPDGTVYWKYGGAGGSPCLGQDGTAYAQYDGGLIALSPDGKKRWSCPAAGVMAQFYSPVVYQNGTVYVIGAGLHAISPAGKLKWSFGSGGEAMAPPALGPDGTIYFGDYEGYFALTPEGKQKWALKTGEEAGTGSALAVGHDGTLYLDMAGLRAVDPHGKFKWQLAESLTGFAVLDKGLVGAGRAAGSRKPRLSVVTASGILDPGLTMNSADELTAVSADKHNVLYMAILWYDENGWSPERGAVLALKDGKEIWTSDPIPGGASSPALGQDGTLYVGGCDGKLYAFGG